MEANAGSVFIGPWRTLRSVLASLDEAGNIDDESLLFRALQIAPSFLPGLLAGGVLCPDLFALGPYHDVVLALLGGLLAFGGLIAGFVANLMLFTGKFESNADLALEVSLAYVARLKELLHSQALTLVTSVVMCMMAICSMIAMFLAAPSISLIIIGAVTFGFTSMCLVRSILLPVQLFELHDAWLNDLLVVKAGLVRRRYSAPSDQAD